ncbi:MAG: hypothetical protein KAW12_19935 [Candidatus Aminicenantes bacterium]|nr:hypothetical protein [Candidatus Aminicenantes bacterium]
MGKSSEIEFLRVMGDRVVPIEVKSGQRTRAKSLLFYRSKYSPELLIKVSANNLQREAGQLFNYPLYLAVKIG